MYLRSVLDSENTVEPPSTDTSCKLIDCEKFLVFPISQSSSCLLWQFNFATLF